LLIPHCSLFTAHCSLRAAFRGAEDADPGRLYGGVLDNRVRIGSTRLPAGKPGGHQIRLKQGLAVLVYALDFAANAEVEVLVALWGGAVSWPSRVMQSHSPAVRLVNWAISLPLPATRIFTVPSSVPAGPRFFIQRGMKYTGH
jgi:hypothetical protein